MSGFCKRLCVVVMTVLVSTAYSNMAFGLDESKMKEFSENDILFYDPDNCENDPNSNSNKVCTMPSGDQITWIGDSYSVGSRDLLDRTFPGVDYNGWGIDQMNTSYIWSGKTVNTDGAGPSGLNILRNIVNAGKLRPYLVFALGANGGWNESTMNEFLGLVGNGTKVILVTMETYPSKHGIENQSYVTENDLLRKTAEEHDNIYLADWAEDGYKDEYFDTSGYSCKILESGYDNCIHPTVNGGYSAWVDVIKNALPRNCASSLLPGDSMEEKIWNWFVEANIQGVSDNPAAIAGIMGNFYIESGYNVYMTRNGYHGIHAMMDTDGSGNPAFGIELRDLLISEVGDYWDDYVTNNRVPGNVFWEDDVNNYRGYVAEENLATVGMNESQIEKAINLSLDFIISNNPRFNDSGNGWAKDLSFLYNVDNVDDTSSPESYSDLFLVTVEWAYGHGGNQALIDSKVQKLANDAGWTGSEWQGAVERRGFARKVYDQYVNGSSSGGNTTTVEADGGVAIAEMAKALSWPYGQNTYDPIRRLSGNGFSSATAKYQEVANKYGLGGIACSFLVYLAVKESVDPNFMDGHDIHSGEIENYILSDPAHWQKVSVSSNSDLVAGDVIINESPNKHSYVYAGDGRIAEAMAIDYNLPGFPPAVIDDHWDVNSYNTHVYRYIGSGRVSIPSSGSQQYCTTNEKMKGAAGAKRIAEVAALMSWPIQKWQAGATDFNSGNVGKCQNSGGNWEEWSVNQEACYTNPRVLYKDNLTPEWGVQGYLDCGTFVSSVLNYLGIATSAMIGGGQPGYGGNLRNDPDWTEISNTGSESILKPGDILWNNQHIKIYVGEEYGGDFGVIADASAMTRVGTIRDNYNFNDFFIFRYTGDKLGADGEAGWSDGTWPEFMNGYVDAASNYEDCYDGVCVGGTDNGRGGLNNCSGLTSWFVNRYTDFSYGLYNGNASVQAFSDISGETIRNGFDETNNNWPEVYSIFSQLNNGVYEGVAYGHTGIVLGIDFEERTIVVAEASYGRFSWEDRNNPSSYSDGCIGECYYPGVNKYSFDKFMSYGLQFVSTKKYLKETPR